jgi:hypothetical protein
MCETDSYILYPRLVGKYIYCSIKSDLKMNRGKSNDIVFFLRGVCSL